MVIEFALEALGPLQRMNLGGVEGVECPRDLLDREQSKRRCNLYVLRVCRRR